MKKSTFKLFLLGLLIPFILTSCLGDTKTVYEPENDLCYVATSDYGTKYAISSSYGGTKITDPYISKLNVGDFYYIAYRWEANQVPNSEGINTVTNARPGTSGGNPLPGGNEFKQISILPNYPTDYQNFESFPYLVDVSPNFYTPYNIFNDKWIFRFSCVAYAEDVVYGLHSGVWRNNIKLNVVLQTTKQGDMTQKNHAMLNIYPERILKREPDITKDPVNFTGYAVVDMRTMRSYFGAQMGEMPENVAKSAYMQFQFYKYNTTTKKYSETVTSIGALPATDDPTGANNSAFYMIISR